MDKKYSLTLSIKDISDKEAILINGCSEKEMNKVQQVLDNLKKYHGLNAISKIERIT
jgi:hypothetical protein